MTSPSARPALLAIDKAIGTVGSPPAVDEVFDRLRGAQIPVEKNKMDEGWAWKVGTGNLWIRPRTFEGVPCIYKVIATPSTFPSFANFERLLSSIFLQGELESIALTRADLALDYPVEFKSLIRGLDVKNKRTKVEFIDKSGVETGIRFGTAENKVQVYDRGRRLSLPTPVTRIEVQLSGRGLPTKTFCDLPSALCKAGWNPFQGITLADVGVRSLDHGKADARADELATLLKHVGFLATRRKLNIQGNFDRDFRPLLDFKPWDEQPSEAFERLIAAFRSQWENQSASEGTL